MKPSQYDQIHKQRDRFVIVPGHETNKIEEVISRENGFFIIKKIIDLPINAKKLNKTDIQNV